MKFVTISDTHGQHEFLSLPQGDVIIHAGDISNIGREREVIDFLSWFKDLDYKYKIFITGNHDFFFEKESPEKIKQLIPENVIYLNDSSVTIEGIKVWGSPITPWFYNWAFNRERGPEIATHWDLIPFDTDILITHGPVFGIHDKTIYNKCVGCNDLLLRINEIQPKIHICGHIHEGYGIENTNGTTFINASTLDHKYKIQNKPICFEM